MLYGRFSRFSRFLGDFQSRQGCFYFIQFGGRFQFVQLDVIGVFRPKVGFCRCTPKASQAARKLYTARFVSIASKRQGPVYLPLLRYIRTLELSGRLYTKVVLGLLRQYRALLIVYLARSLTISAIAFYIIAARSIIDGVGGSRFLSLGRLHKLRGQVLVRPGQQYY